MSSNSRFSTLLVLALVAGLVSCTKEVTYDYEYDDGDVYRGGYYIDGDLYIPMVLDSGNEYASGDSGDFYVQYWGLDSESSYSPDILSSMTEKEWDDFVTKGFYGGYRYDLSFGSQNDFWDSYYGGEENDVNEGGGITASWYYYSERMTRPVLARSFSGWLKDSEWYYSADGFNWRIQPQGCPYDGPYFGFGLDKNIFTQERYSYDEDGAKFVFLLTIPSKDPELPNINFYAQVHVYKQLDIYIPFMIYPDSPTKPEGGTGDIYIKRYNIRSYSTYTPDVLSGISYDEWKTFISTGQYGDDFYDIVLCPTEEDFWDNYWGGADPGLNAVSDGFHSDAYYCVKGDGDAGDEYEPLFSFWTDWIGGTEPYWNYYGLCWRVQPLGCPWTAPYLGFGVISTVEGESAYPYDEDGAKYLFVLTFPSRDTYDHPNIAFYTFLHVQE